MADILIRGMKMPKNCNACELAALVDISDGLVYGCRALKEMISNDRERLPNCPLVPVPEHGRLIDANALIRDWPTGFVKTADVINNAPTIIPAEKGE